jgi:CRISPR/Cas system CSM-associated protein Csm5 (group 7 of RAMP superfamily)
MKSIDQFEFELYPLTPIFIGSDDLWEPNEYLVRDGKVVKVKIDRMLQDMYERSEQEVEEFAEASASDPEKAVSILEDKVTDEYIQESYPLMNGFEETYREKLKTSVEILSIQLPTRYRRDVYIPGTSLKGTIRTALYALMGQEKNHPSEGELFGYDYPFNDPFKRFKISDVPAKDDMLGLRTLERTNIKENKPGAPESYAITINGLINDPNEDPAEQLNDLPDRSDLRLMGDVQFVNHFEEMSEQLNVKSLIDATSEFSRSIIEYEKEKPIVGEWYSRFMEGLGQYMTEPEVTLVRVGSGSGRMGTSVLLYNEQAVSKATGEDNPHPVTRQLADGIPMGWALLRFRRD